MKRASFLPIVAIMIAACHPSGTPGDGPAASSSIKTDYKPTTPTAPRVVEVTGAMTLADVSTKLLSGECADAMLVWGDVSVDAELGKPIRIKSGSVTLDGYLICQATGAETFLRKQAKNPRMLAGHGGTANVHYRDGQLRMVRRWSAGEIALGDMSTVPEGVFQKGEALAALVELEADKAAGGLLVPMFANLAKAFVFAMWPLK